MVLFIYNEDFFMNKIISFCLAFIICTTLVGCGQYNKNLSNEDINKLLIDEGYEFDYDSLISIIWNKEKDIDILYIANDEEIIAETMREDDGVPIPVNENENCGVFSLNGVRDEICQYKNAGKDILDDELYRLGITLDQLLEFIEYKSGG